MSLMLIKEIRFRLLILSNKNKRTFKGLYHVMNTHILIPAGTHPDENLQMAHPINHLSYFNLHVESLHPKSNSLQISN